MPFTSVVTNRIFEFLRQKQMKFTDIYGCLHRTNEKQQQKMRTLEIWHFEMKLFRSNTSQRGTQSATFDLIYSGKTLIRLIHPLDPLKNVVENSSK